MAAEARKAAKQVPILAVSTAYELTTTDHDASQLAVQVVGSINAGSFSIQGSLDGGTTKVKLLMVPWGSTTTVTDPTAAGAWRVDTSGIKRVYLVTDGSVSPVDGTVVAYAEPVRG